MTRQVCVTPMSARKARRHIVTSRHDGSSAFLSPSELKAGGAAGHHVNFLSRLDHLIPLGERLAGGRTEATQDPFYAISTGRRAVPTGLCSHSFVRRALHTATRVLFQRVSSAVDLCVIHVGRALGRRS